MVKLKCSTSPSFLPIFSNFSRWQNWTVSIITGRRMFARTLGLARLFTPRNASCAKIHQPVARLLRQPLLYLLRQHLIWHLVCVCVCVCQDEILSHISSCALSQSINWQKCHNKTGSFEWHPSIHAKTTGEDGETELSSHAPARPQTARLKHVRHIETPRSAKHEANNRLFKIWPLWQNISIRIVFISVAKTCAHSCLHCPSAILQREGFWQHKGLGKHINTHYDFGCECHPDLQRIGNTETEKGLASCWRWISIFEAAMPSSSSFLIASQHKQSHKAKGGHLQWTSLCFLHYKQLCWASCLTTLAYPHKPWTHRTCCWQGNSAD